jgi:ADP-ribosylglycohydrolase
LPSSYPSLIHFAAKYSEDFEKALLANANTGGENVHRGCVLGAVLGAYHGEKAIPAHLKDGLHDAGAIRKEIEAFKAAVAKSSM